MVKYFSIEAIFIIFKQFIQIETFHRYYRIIVNRFLSTIFRIILKRNGFSKFLLIGNSSKTPTISDKNPGDSKNIPPAKIQSPSISVSPGIWPDCIWCCAFLNVSIPCLFASQAPQTPVKMINRTVGMAPMVLPERRRTPISSAGMTIIKNSNNLIFSTLPRGNV